MCVCSCVFVCNTVVRCWWKQIAEDTHDEGYPFSYVKKYWDDMYLELRSPISVHVNVGYSLCDDETLQVPDKQAHRVAQFLLSTVRSHTV